MHHVAPNPAQVDRIEAVRRTINQDSGGATEASVDIMITDLLGEGAFGKVYKGELRDRKERSIIEGSMAVALLGEVAAVFSDDVR